MRFVNFAVVKLSLFLTGGIVAGYFFPSDPVFFFKLVSAGLLVLVLLWFLNLKNVQPNKIFTVVAFGTFFLLGYVNVTFRLPDFQPGNAQNFIKKDSFQLVQCKVKSVLKPNVYTQNFIAKVIAVDGNLSTGTILVSVKKDSLFQPFYVDDELLISAKFSEVFSNRNPYTFDYSKYLKTLGINNQVRISGLDVLEQRKGKKTLLGIAASLRNHIILKLKENNLTKDELAIIEALLLGERKDISKALYEGYQKAGATHILAVSGLHVGIVLLLISFLLKPLHYLKGGKTSALLLTVVLLWGFALIAGLSVSVVRAVTMFSFLVLAQLINRETNAINTLFLSYFFLLLLNPLWLFQVGFQLSYVAVFFILWMHPKLYKYYRPRFYLDKLFWGILTITFVVQIGVTPLLLYYFHQFSGLSFLTNIVILPFLGIILSLGIFTIVLALINALPVWLSVAFNYVIEWLNTFVLWASKQDGFIVSNISFSGYKVFASYLVIVSFVLVWKNRNAKNSILALSSVVVFLVFAFFEKQATHYNEFIIFHKTRTSVMAYKNGSNLRVLTNDTTINYLQQPPVKDYYIANRIAKRTIEKLPFVFTYNKKMILVLDSLGLYPNHKIDYVVLTHSPKIHLDRLIDSLQPRQIIADGSNYRSYIERWKKTCKRRKLPFHYTGTKGAFILE